MGMGPPGAHPHDPSAVLVPAWSRLCCALLALPSFILALGFGDLRHCSSFCLDNGGYAVFGANYDYMPDKYDGLVFVNKRGVFKSFKPADSPGEHAHWTSKYGSVTFNFIASQTAWAGMNEAGLVAYSMRLEEGSTPPAPDGRPWIHAHHWLQYILDTCSTIEEVLAADAAVRIASVGRIPHYLVSDRYARCATVEFIGGKMVAHSAGNLPVKALANDSYDYCVGEWDKALAQRKKGKPVPIAGGSSRARFIRAADQLGAFKPTDSPTAVVRAFDILKDLATRTANWSMVFDARNLRAHFKTIIHPEIRLIDFQKLDFSCRTPGKLLDINEKLAGDITERLVDYSFEYHYGHAWAAAKKYKLEMSAKELEEYIQAVEAFPCGAAEP